MAKTWRVAVIGRSGHGNYGHGLDTVWSHVPNVEVVAVADDNKSALPAALRRTGAKTPYTDYRQMLDEEKLVDLVVGRGGIVEDLDDQGRVLVLLGQAVDDRGRDLRSIEVDHTEADLELGGAADEGAEHHGHGQGRADGHDDRRPVADPSPQVGEGDQPDAHVSPAGPAR